MTAPRPERPYMPEYNVNPGPAGMLAWDDALRRFSASRNYWLATTRPGGRPHLAPVWGVWLDGAFYFSTAASSRKARNLSTNGSCVVTAESADPAATIVEGVASIVTDAALMQRVCEAYAVKYDWPMTVTDKGVGDADGNGGPLFEVRPTLAFGFSEDLGTTATRWRFS